MAEQQEQQTAPTETPAPRVSKKRVFKLPDGTTIPVSEWKSISKFDRDVLIYYHGEQKQIIPATAKKKEKVEWVTEYNPEQALLDTPIPPSIHSPICQQCGLYEHNCRNPFMAYAGADDPLITIVFDGVTRAEDIQGELGKEDRKSVV